MTLWLVGAGGMLGRAFAERLRYLGTHWVQTDAELDIADGSAVRALVSAERPTTIINCAGYTRVDDAETHANEAEASNALGPENLALAAQEAASCLVHFSTDYVFAGDAREPYDELAACAPKSVYGRTKWEGERRVLAHENRGRTYVVRTSWLFGAQGCNFVRTIVRLLAIEPELRVVSDQIGRPTYAPDLVTAVTRLIGLEPCGVAAAEPGLYHYANDGATSWHAFAGAIREAALRRRFPVRTRDVIPVATSEFPRPAPRPSYSVLSTGRFEAATGSTPRPWWEALEVCMDQLGVGARAESTSDHVDLLAEGSSPS